MGAKVLEEWQDLAAKEIKESEEVIAKADRESVEIEFYKKEEKKVCSFFYFSFRLLTCSSKKLNPSTSLHSVIWNRSIGPSITND
jgi:hypothetical protein